MYRRLAETGALDLEVVFLAEKEPDRPWDLGALLEGVPYQILPGFTPSVRSRRNTFVYEINPGILKLLRSEPWDVLVVGGYAVFAEQVAIAYARAARIPYILHSESHLSKQRSGILRAAKRAVLPMVVGNAAAGLAVGSAAARYLEAYGLPRGRIRIVPNTIDVEDHGRRAAEARDNAAAIRARLDLPERYVLYVGRLIEAKGVGDLVSALELLGDDAPVLVAAGEGPMADTLAATPHVQLVGFQEHDRLVELYALADAFVLPSRDEPWGVVVNEALACGTPVIVTDAVGAAEDLVTEGANGVIVPVGDVRSLAEALAGPYPTGRDGRIARWTYEFAVEQFLDGISLALS